MSIKKIISLVISVLVVLTSFCSHRVEAKGDDVGRDEETTIEVSKDGDVFSVHLEGEVEKDTLRDLEEHLKNAKMPQWATLDVTMQKIDADRSGVLAGVVRYFSHKGKLTSLVLRDFPLNEEDAEFLAQGLVSAAGTLEAFTWAESHVTDEELAPLLKMFAGKQGASFARLKHLDLSYNTSLTDKSGHQVKDLVALHCPKLTSINLDHTGISTSTNPSPTLIGTAPDMQAAINNEVKKKVRKQTTKAVQDLVMHHVGKFFSFVGGR